MKIRKWFFKLLTGYDLIEYKEILDDFKKAVELSETLSKESKDVLRNAKEINNLNRKIIDYYKGEDINETMG